MIARCLNCRKNMNPDTHICPNSIGKLAKSPRIVVSCDNSQLKTAVDEWASGKLVRLYYYEPDTPDVIMWSGDVFICDRNYMHEYYWRGYVAYLDELNDGEVIEMPDGERIITKDDSVIIIVDSLTDLLLPAHNRVEHVTIEPWTEIGMRRITEILDGVLAEYERGEGRQERADAGC